MSQPSDQSAPANSSRRTFLRRLLVASTALAVEPTLLLPGAAARGRVARWSDRSTWGRRIPGRRDIARINKPVLLDVNARVAGVAIGKRGALIFHPNRSVTLQSTGNVVVLGRLKMEPASATRRHKLLFTGINEERFIGGGMKVQKPDIGLWVMGAGRLLLEGAPKRSWTRAAGSIPAGARRIRLASDPNGWRVGDEITITPTVRPSRKRHHLAYDSARVTAINGRVISLSRRTRFHHPQVAVGRGRRMTAEVLNLTRNVRVEGTRRGRAHIFIHSHSPQSVRYAALRHLGPRKKLDRGTTLVIGRYCLHFHHCGHGSHGSFVNGVVVRDAGNHAYVPHMSHGVTVKDCISHNTFETPYWWDKETLDQNSSSNRIVFDRCVASLVRVDPIFDSKRLAGFWLPTGKGNKARECVAVGVQGKRWPSGITSGFHWPELDVYEDGWLFERCVAHNNRSHGIHAWQNHGIRTVINRFVAYHNGGAGIAHGAYKNGYHYTNSILYGNSAGAVELIATGNRRPGLVFSGLLCDGAGESAYAIRVSRHKAVILDRTKFVDCVFRGYKKAAVGFVPGNASDGADQVDFVNCSYKGNEFWLDGHIHPDSRIRIQDRRHGAIQLARWDQLLEGELVTRWNARRKIIRRFAK